MTGTKGTQAHKSHSEGGPAKADLLAAPPGMQAFAELERHTAAVTRLSFAPGGSLLATCSRDKRVVLTDIASGQQVQ